MRKFLFYNLRNSVSFHNKFCFCDNVLAGQTKCFAEFFMFNPLTHYHKKQTTKFSSANLKKNVKFKLYQIENSKTIGQRV